MGSEMCIRDRLQFVGLSGTFVFSLLVYLACLLFTLRLRIGREVIRTGSHESVISNLLQGLRHLKQTPLLFALLMVTAVYNLFGFPLLSLVPVLGRDALALSPGMVGLLASMEGAGALVGSVLVLRFGVIPHYRRIYVGGLFIYFAASLMYSLVTWTLPVALLLALAGVGSAAFAAMQTTLLILNSSASYRGRLFGMLSLSIGVGVFGFILVGLLANALGVHAAIAVSSTLGLLSTFAICLYWPAVLALQPSKNTV